MRTNQDADWERLEAARTQIAHALRDNPNVSLVDIGLDPQSTDEPAEVVVRIHLRHPVAVEELQLPTIDGVRIRVIHANYRLE